MLPSLAAKQAKADKHDSRLSDEKYAKKFRQKQNITGHVEGGFSAMFKNVEERENWLEQREKAKRDSVSR